MELYDYIRSKKIIVIVRRVYGEQLLHLAKALHVGGVRMMEVTFDQADSACIEKTSAAIRMLKAELGDRMHFGAGTVLTAEQVDAAHAAGAEYIISPNVCAQVIERTKALGLLSIPGAMTPTEIISADKLGADFVKLFPVSDLGLSYFKNISGPISHVQFVATAGVTEENFGAMLEAGFVGAGISGRLTDKKLIEAGDFAEITRRAGAFVEIAKNNGERV